MEDDCTAWLTTDGPLRYTATLPFEMQ